MLKSFLISCIMTAFRLHVSKWTVAYVLRTSRSGSVRSFPPLFSRFPGRFMTDSVAVGVEQGCARLVNQRQHDSSYQPLVMDPSPQLPPGTNYTTSTIVPRSNRTRCRQNRKGLTTQCVQSAQSRTRSSELAFLRTVLVWLSTCIPYQMNIFQTTQKRNL